MGNKIIEEVNNIWKPLDKYLPKNFLSIDGDELIKICAYIIIKAKMPEILSHLSFIKNFTTKDTKTSMIGYYYNTIEAGVIMAKNIVAVICNSYVLISYKNINHNNQAEINMNSI